jgi:hypothetical protein
MTALADYPAPPDTPLLGKTGVWAPQPIFGTFKIERDETLHGYPLVAPWFSVNSQPVGPGWVNLGDQVKVIVLVPSTAEMIELGTPVNVMPKASATYIVAEPSFKAALGTGDLFAEVRESVEEVWQGLLNAVPSPAVATAPLLLDVPAALQQARSLAGLPVQDLAAMFGIKRRQFYNLSSGEQQPESEREQRIARVTEAINTVSDWVGGNSRKVRALLLARLDGDSIYDAAVADDDDRLSRALELGYSVGAQGTVLPPHLAPSNRATAAEVAAAREFLRSTRDDTGAKSDQ